MIVMNICPGQQIEVLDLYQQELVCDLQHARCESFAFAIVH